VTLLEAVVRHERRILLASLAAIPILCAAWIVPMARDMYGAMNGPSAWMMTRVWDARHVSLLAAMWIVMMIGMMLPSVAPMLMIYAGVLRASPEGPRAALRVYPMAAGYLLVWIAFSLLMTFVQRALGETVLTPMMTLRSSITAAVLLCVAAVYQLTPIKESCLSSCQSPISFIMRRMRLDAAGALRLGIEHGLYCVGCCWALMLLLFAGGIMNLWTITALMLVVLLEKLAPFGMRTRLVNAAGLVAAAVWFLVR
jgi:predicted metal-binding membrane protein